MAGIDIERMRHIGSKVSTQDNAGTADPIYVVYEKREIVTSPEHDYDRICWFDHDGQEEADAGTHKQLEWMRNDIDSLFLGEDEITLGNHDEGEEVEWTRHAMKEVPEFVTVCFTLDAANAYIKTNRHNLRRPYVYAHSLYRNPEMKAVRECLIRMGEES